MRDSIEVTGLGTIHLTRPRSFVAISDLFAEWTGQPSRAVMTRLICASIGLAWDRDKNTSNAPIYDVSGGEIVAYGGAVMDWMLKDGATPGGVWGHSDLVGDLWALLPKEEDVAAAADSFLKDSGTPGRASTTDSETVAQGA